MLQPDREELGKAVRSLWVAFAAARPDPKPHHLLPWEELDEENKEVDRIIGEALYAWGYRDGVREIVTPLTEYTGWGAIYPLGDGRRVVVMERDDGKAWMWIERPWKRVPHRFTRDRTTPSQLIETAAMAHRFAAEMSKLTHDRS